MPFVSYLRNSSLSWVFKFISITFLIFLFLEFPQSLVIDPFSFLKYLSLLSLFFLDQYWHTFVYLLVYTKTIFCFFVSLVSLECDAFSHLYELNIVSGAQIPWQIKEEIKEPMQISHFYLKNKYIIFNQTM